METLGTRLAKALDESPLASAAELARAARTTEATVSGWLKDNVTEENAKGALAVRMAQALDVRVQWLLLGHQPMRDTKEPVRIASDEIPPGYLRLPQLDMPAGAGPGVDMELEPDVVRWVDVAEKWAEDHFAKKVAHIRVLTARGDSMVGAGIHSGDLLFVDTSVQQYQGDGFYILQFLDGWQVKRLRADVLSQQVEIVSLTAQGEESKLVPPARLSELRMGGRVAAWWTLRKY